MQKVVLVTGSNSGLGRVVCALFVAEGWQVYGGVRNLAESKSESGIHPVRLDITNDKECAEVIERIRKETGRLNLLVNCAGLSVSGLTLDSTPTDFIRILDTNAVGAFRLIRAAVPLMRKTGGKIVNVTSLNGLVSLPNFGLYSASKHALQAISEALHYELAKDNIWVTSLAPGAIYNPDTDLKGLKHKPLRERLKFLYLLFPMVSRNEVAGKIREIAISPRPPVTVIVGRDALLVTLFQRCVPAFVWNSFMAYLVRKK